ncbi:hypothetical protein Tco_1445996, partial [Tanacetum coccineum]
ESWIGKLDKLYVVDANAISVVSQKAETERGRVGLTKARCMTFTLRNRSRRRLKAFAPQLHESAGDLPSLKLSLHSCSLPGSTNAMGIETSIALVLPAREHECDTSFVLRRLPALS